MPDFHTSGIQFTPGIPDVPVQMFFEPSLFDQAQSLIEQGAVATGNSPALVPGKIEGSFCVVIARDQDGNKLFGLLPSAPINADIINAS